MIMDGTEVEGDDAATSTFCKACPSWVEVAQPLPTRVQRNESGKVLLLSRLDHAYVNLPTIELRDMQPITTVMGNPF